MRLCNAEYVRQVEQNAITSGYTSDQMINRAGLEFARLIRSRILNCTRMPVIVLCGRGNNGKDGQVVADILLSWGFQVRTFQLVDSEQLSLSQKNNLIETLKKSSVIIDALLGMGQKRHPQGSVKDVLQIVKDFKASAYSSKLISISLDVPTGVNSDTGLVFDDYFEADHTVCVQWIKQGLLQFPARGVCGQLSVVNIGLDSISDSTDNTFNNIQFYTSSHAKIDLFNIYNRPLNCHKGSFGKVYVLEGIESTIGACALTVSAAIKIGAPLVFSIAKKNNQKSYFMPCESMKLFIDDKSSRGFLPLLKKISANDCLVIGPGFGLTPERRKTFWQLFSELSKLDVLPNIVLDADALTILSQPSDIQKKLFAKIDKSKVVLTPHPKEASVLLGCQISDIESNRYQSALNMINKYKVGAVVLKGSSTIVLGHSNNNNNTLLTVHTNGKSSLATGGSGDVLSGIIAGMLVQMPFLNAVNSAVYVHGQTSSMIKSPVIQASDIIQAIPSVLVSIGEDGNFI